MSTTNAKKPKMVAAKEITKRHPTGHNAIYSVDGKLLKIESPEKKMAAIPKARVLFNNILTSCHSIHSNSIILSPNEGGNLSTRQVVVATGSNAQVNIGDWIEINVDMFPHERKPGKHDVGTVTKYHPPIENINGVDYLLLSDRHVKYIYE